MPQFLRKRRAGLPVVADLARELGIERPLLFALKDLDLRQRSYGGPVTLAQIRADNPYRTIDVYSPAVAALVEKGLVLQDENGAYSLAPRAREVVDRLNEAGMAHVAAMHPLPESELEALAHQLQRAVDAMLADPVLAPRPGSRLKGSHTLAEFGEDAPPMVRIEQAIHDLWMARDDVHARAWRDAGMEGPPMAVLTCLWSGEAHTVSEVQAVFEREQTPEDVESSLAYLAEKDYVTRDGDDVLQLTPEGVLVREDVERETDRMYFAPWPHTREEAVWVRDRLTQLIENLGQN
jgi:hypothetical protein